VPLDLVAQASAGPVRVLPLSHPSLRILLLITSLFLDLQRAGRFRDQMRIGSVIIKSTAYPEWHSSQLIPWYHYVPMRYDALSILDLDLFALELITDVGVSSSSALEF
jgi:hypothetical protein